MSKATSVVLAQRPNNSVAAVAFEDMSRYQHVGTENTITDVQLASGKWVKSFDGVASGISIPDARVFDLTNRFTIECWIMPTGDGAGDSNRFLVGKDYGNWCLYHDWLTDRVALRLNGLDVLSTSASSISDNIWQHIVVTYDKDAGGTDEAKCYINGVLEDDGNYAIAVSTTADVVGIGRDEEDNDREFLGLIDEVIIRNHTLSQEQIQNRYEATKGWYT